MKKNCQGKALVIFSGGQDSTTCLYYALQYYESVEAISFHYGQKHSVELDCASKICLSENVKHTIVDISFFKHLVDSALTSNGDVNQTNEKGLPASFVPNRNALFITLSHAYAQKIGALAIVTGVCQTDYNGYPDCRRQFINQIDSALNYGSQSDIILDTPLMSLTKAQTWDVADELGVVDRVRWSSHTCYNGDRLNEMASGYGCSKCGACELREQGYQEYVLNKSLK